MIVRFFVLNKRGHEPPREEVLKVVRGVGDFVPRENDLVSVPRKDQLHRVRNVIWLYSPNSNEGYDEVHIILEETGWVYGG